MKTLNTPGLTELSQKESAAISGGGSLLPALAGFVIYNILNDWDQFKAALAGNPEPPQN